MKKHSLLIGLTLAMTAASLSTLFSGCDDDDWPYNPPPGWGSNYFYDSRLNGTWQLTYDDNKPVIGYGTNYMDFYGGGHGRYYYYSNGRLMSEEIAYFCQERRPNSTLYQINVQYEDGGASTMAYAISNGGTSLSLQWRSGGEIHSYIYSKTDYIPY